MSFPFSSWLSLKLLFGGDWPVFWPENINNFLSYTYAWDQSLNSGFGKSNVEILWLNSYLGYMGDFLVNTIHIPWALAEKLMFFWPIIIMSFISSFFLSRLFIKKNIVNFFAGVIYLTNTYVLMIASGGQVGILLSYSLAPLTIYFFIKLLNESFSDSPVNIKRYSGFLILVCFVQILFEPRLFLITSFGMIAVFLMYVYLSFLFNKNTFFNGLKRFVKYILFCIVFIIILHAFWILPAVILLFQKENLTFNQSVDSVKYFSFTFFENAFSMLHPNWPENVFGKTYLMRWQFLVLPFTILLLPIILVNKSYSKRLNKIQKTLITSFMLLFIIGVFLAKGTNEPLGIIYVFATQHIPFAGAFRDSSKFFLLIVLSYTLLLPIITYLIAVYIHKRIKCISISIVFITAFILWIVLHYQAWNGTITGTFVKQKIPDEYSNLYTFLNNDSIYYRTLWVPRIDRFTPRLQFRPAISINDFKIDSQPDSIKLFFSAIETKKLLTEWRVKYIIIPFDTDNNIFVTDRTYDEDIMFNIKAILDNVSYLEKIQEFGKIIVYKNKEEIPSKISTDRLNEITYSQINPSEYSFNLDKSDLSKTIYFSEKYDKHWVITDPQGQKIISNNTKFGSNEFRINLAISGIYTLYYSIQDWVNIGKIITCTGLGMLIFWLVKYGFKQKK